MAYTLQNYLNKVKPYIVKVLKDANCSQSKVKYKQVGIINDATDETKAFL